MPKEESIKNELYPKLRASQKFYSRNSKSLSFSSLAESYRVCGMLTEAIQTSLEGLSYFPDCLSARTTLALCYIERGNSETAISELEKIVSTQRNLLYPLKLLLGCYERAGNLNKALPIGLHILKQYPFDFELEAKVEEWQKDFPIIAYPENKNSMTEDAEGFEMKTIDSLFCKDPTDVPQVCTTPEVISKKTRKINLLSNILLKLQGISNGA